MPTAVKLLAASLPRHPLPHTRALVTFSSPTLCSLYDMLNIISGLLLTFEGPVSHTTHSLYLRIQFQSQGLIM